MVKWLQNIASSKEQKKFIWMIVSIFIGFILGYLQISFVEILAKYIVEVFMNLLKFVSLPIIFLSISSSINKLAQHTAFKCILTKTITYTISTTMISALIAMGVYMLINPVFRAEDVSLSINNDLQILDHLLNMVPSNIIKIFLEGNVIAIVLAGFLVGYASVKLESEEHKNINNLLSSLFALFMAIVKPILQFLPFILWAFMVLFVKDIKSGSISSSIFLYMATILVANILQSVVILPIFLKIKDIPIISSLKGMLPALITAFFSKSSAATMPTTLHCIENRLKVPKNLSSLTVPLCSTINMNACAAFIYITVLFVAESNGAFFSLSDNIIWIFLATIAAIGNASVPMGCYFMASAYLAAMNVPIYLMGVILPFYTLLDMLETAINIWSDACITLVVNKECKDKI